MASVLLIAGTTPLTAGDAKVQTQLTNLGHTVTVAAETVTHTAAQMNAYGLVVILESVSSATFVTNSGDAARDTTAPVACFEHGAWPHLGMATDRVRATAQKTMYVADDTHPAAGWLNDATHEFTTVTTQGSDYGTGLGAGATVVYSHHAAKTDANGFAYESGGTMTVGTAPARRFGLGMHTDLLPGLESPGERMLRGVFNWLIDGTSLPSVEPAASTEILILAQEDGNDPRLSTSDAAMRDRLAGQGWTVEVVDDDVWRDSYSVGRSMVIEVSSARGEPLLNSLTAIDCPLMTSEGEWTDRTMGVVGSPPVNGHGSSATIYLEDDTHPIAAGLTIGTVTVHSDPTAQINWCRIPRQAPYQIIAYRPGWSTDITVAAVEANSTLEDGSVNAHRLVYHWHYHTSFENYTADALSLFDAAVSWLTAGTPPPPPVAGTSEWTDWVSVQTVADPGQTKLPSAWTSYREAFVPVQPVNEWYVAAGSAWAVADMVSLS